MAESLTPSQLDALEDALEALDQGTAIPEGLPSELHGVFREYEQVLRRVTEALDEPAPHLDLAALHRAAAQPEAPAAAAATIAVEVVAEGRRSPTERELGSWWSNALTLFTPILIAGAAAIAVLWIGFGDPDPPTGYSGDLARGGGSNADGPRLEAPADAGPAEERFAREESAELAASPSASPDLLEEEADVPADRMRDNQRGAQEEGRSDLAGERVAMLEPHDRQGADGKLKLADSAADPLSDPYFEPYGGRDQQQAKTSGAVGSTTSTGAPQPKATKSRSAATGAQIGRGGAGGGLDSAIQGSGGAPAAPAKPGDPSARDSESSRSSKTDEVAQSKAQATIDGTPDAGSTSTLRDELTRAHGLRHQAKCASALTVYRELLAANPGLDPAGLGEAEAGLALCLVAQGQHKEASALFESAKRRDASIAKWIERERPRSPGAPSTPRKASKNSMGDATAEGL